MKRKKSLRAAAESTHTAAERRDAADRAVQAISDYVETFSPYLTEAQKRVEPLLEQAHKRVDPLIESAQEKVQPLAHQARKTGADRAQQALDAITPKLNDALDKVTPAVDAARDKVQSDLLPRLNDALSAAADTEVGKEAGKRGKAVAAALKGEIEVKEKKGGVLRTLGILALLGGLAGAAYVAFKKFFDTSSGTDAWKAYEPTSPYAKPAPAKAEADEAPDFPEEQSAAEQFDRVDEPVVTDTDVTSTLSDTSGEDAAFAAGADAETVDKGEKADAANGYGDGSYVGEEPPEGFAIKGNERSKKYHTSDSAGYDRTIADVWFASEDAAQAAGFTKAQR